MPRPTEQQWYTPGQVAEQLGRCVTTVRRWIAAGTLEAIILPSGRYLISRETLEFWLTPLGEGEP